MVDESQAEDDGRGSQVRRQGHVFGTGCWIARRVVVDDEDRHRSRRHARGNEDVRHGDGRAVSRAMGDDVPGQQSIARREAGNGERFDGLVRHKWTENLNGRLRITQRQRRDTQDASVTVACRAGVAHEFSDDVVRGLLNTGVRLHSDSPSFGRTIAPLSRMDAAFAGGYARASASARGSHSRRCRAGVSMAWLKQGHGGHRRGGAWRLARDRRGAN